MEVTKTKSTAEIKRQIQDSNFTTTSLSPNQRETKEVDASVDTILESSFGSILSSDASVKSHYQQAVKWLLLQIRYHTILMEFVDKSDLCEILAVAFRRYKHHYSRIEIGLVQEVDTKDLQGLLLSALAEVEKIFNRHLVEVFVYGTLMSNESRHYLIESTEFLGEDAIENADLFDLGAYPMLVLHGNNTVFGECYRISLKTLQLLDKVEGHPHYYQRCWCYLKSERRAIVYKGSQAMTLNSQCIPDGRWSFSRKQAISTTLSQTKESLLAEVFSLEGNLDELPLSLAQQYLWYKTQSEPDNSVYNVAASYKIVGCLDLSVLDQSLREVIRRHSILRTTFPTVNGKPVQIVSLDPTFTLSVMDLQDVPEVDRVSHIDDVLTEQVRQSFNIERDPLLCMKLLLVDEEEHILLLTMHRLIADEWSLNLFVQEMVLLYEALMAGTTLLLPEVTHQYTDFSRQQRQYLQGDVLEEQLKYWKHQLHSNLTALDLPTEQPKSLPQACSKKQHSKLSKELISSLKLLAEQEKVTLFTILLTVLKILLYRYTQSTDIIVGSYIANRNQAQTKELVGPLANTLFIRTQLKDGLSFRELLTHVDQVVLDASNNQDIPFDYVLDVLQLQHNNDQSSLLQVKFTLRGEPKLAIGSQELILSTLEIKDVNEGFALALLIEEVEQELLASWEYSTSLFDADTVGRMIGHFQTLLSGIVANPEQSISTLPLLTSEEQNQLLVSWNPEQPEYSKNICLHELIEAQVEKSPTAVAIRFEGEQLTYLELNQRANQLAHHLQTLGVTSETPVGLCMEMSLYLAVAILGLFKAGGVYVPLEPTYPVDRIAFVLEDTQLPILLTQEKFLERLPKLEMQVVCLDTIWEALAQKSIENPVSGVTGENIAYILYTSGSTGKPKGVQLSHSVCCSRELWEQKTFKLTESDRVLMKSSWSSREFFWPLIVGAQVIMARSGGYQDSKYLAKLISEQGVTVISLVPSVLKLLLEEPKIETCTSLRHVISTGEALPNDLQEEFLNRLPAQLHNVYGLNEANYSTHWTYKRENQQQGKVPIGYPTDMQIYLLDPHLQLVPIGVPGEIHISGFGLAQGYFNRPNLNAERFIPNFLSTNTSSRLFKTGDLARYRSDGVIEYLGRIDYQVNIRGLRVELGEIEFVLKHHSAVREAVVIQREDTPGDKSLVGYVVLNKDHHASVNELRHHLKQKLPDYMIPAVFVYLDALPMTPNGKVARLALPVPSRKRSKADKTFVAPTNSVERQIADIWASVLKVDQISIHDDFFELGGYSLLATRVIARLHKIFGVELSLQGFTEKPTIAELSIALKESV
ncbi:amino acid adenylation enzyme/thioester reductase family protein (plasmid) [Cylindrospermum stagnale PCC 7417]|uniref:Amino acid adenylation enzyme/thioester reductase family protein n=1 Tax=Cylindrospermum stagnale PCC 7417 TaxID=56107 RepID=K9X6Z8_9NOST|nr:non-ribosomal peptide synthetase [Cylindrospermum stagnale]AFZ28263.1 amino acid adenylation enzyme/thioester reductase family protein [Cylindrospermum stagnale PCC 7417]